MRRALLVAIVGPLGGALAIGLIMLCGGCLKQAEPTFGLGPGDWTGALRGVRKCTALFVSVDRPEQLMAAMRAVPQPTTVDIVDPMGRCQETYYVEIIVAGETVLRIGPPTPKSRNAARDIFCNVSRDEGGQCL